MLSVYPSDRAIAGLVLGHGAGSGQHSGFMVEAGRQLSARAITVATFDFPYITAGRKTPDKAPVLEQAWRSAIAEVRAHDAFRSLPLFIGGKSMGGRIASHVAAQGIEGVSGLVFLGYPLHPPGKPEQLRSKHLGSISAPMLFIQGSKDSFGTPDELRPIIEESGLSAKLYEIEGGDHSFKVPKRSPVTQEQVYENLMDEITTWIARIVRPG